MTKSEKIILKLFFDSENEIITLSEVNKKLPDVHSVKGQLYVWNKLNDSFRKALLEMCSK